MSLSGYVQEIRPRETKVGIMYDLVIDGQKIGAGKFKPKGVDVGDYVNYDITMNGNFRNLAPGSLSKTTPPPGTSPAPARSATVSAGSASYSDRQDVISKQSALNSALAFVDILAKTDSLPIPGNAKKADKADLVEKVLLEYTARFYNMNTGNTFHLPDATAKGSGDGSLAAAEAADERWDE